MYSLESGFVTEPHLVSVVFGTSSLHCCRIGKRALSADSLVYYQCLIDEVVRFFFPFLEIKQDKTSDMFAAGSLKDDRDFAHALRLLAKPFFPERYMTQGKCLLGCVS